MMWEFRDFTFLDMRLSCTHFIFMADYDPNESMAPAPAANFSNEPAPQAQAPPQQPKKSGKKEKLPPPPPPQYILDTLNESVSQTICRDLKMIMLRTYQVVWIFGRPSNPEVYEQWDIFGPLFYSLVLGIISYFTYKSKGVGADWVLPTIICIIFIIGFILAVNMALLGAKANIMGTISLLGYCVAP